jgi:hypothetical protein
MIIRVSWLKYILASLGPIFIVTGIADRNLSNVMLGLRPQCCELSRTLLSAAFCHSTRKRRLRERYYTEGAKQVTPLKRKVWGFAILAFGVLIALSSSGQ